MLIVGTIVGAGLASGQEIVVFFAQHGFISIIFLVPVFFVFNYGIKQFLSYGKRYYTVDFKENKIFRLYDFLSFFIFVAIGSAMVAGGNELLNEYVFKFNFPVWSFIIILISTIVVYFGIKGLLNLSIYLVPIMVVGIVFVCVKGTSVSSVSSPAFSTDFLSVFMLSLSTISYCCCNMITANQVLFESGSKLCEKQIKKVSFFSSLILTTIIGIIIVAILLTDKASLFAELPLVFMAFLIGKETGVFFCVVLFLSILTTLFATQYSFVQILNRKIKLKRKKLASCLISLLTILIVSFFGFGEIITYFYPILGVFGFVMLFQLKSLSLKPCLNRTNNEIHSSR